MRSVRVQEVTAYRGMITDRYGRVLALSIPVKSVYMDPRKLHNEDRILLDNRWKILSKIVKIPLKQIVERINTNPKRRFVYLIRQVNNNTANYIKKLDLPGIHLLNESRRYYPSNEVNAHLIGLTNIDNKGIEGVEKSFDEWLTGYSGERIIRKDLHGHIIENISYISSQNANNLTLSIDGSLQALVYRELNNAVNINKAESGNSVLIDISTGEILAMANSPSYNPNNFDSTAKNAIRNRSVTDLFEPGSTVKPMVVMAALSLGIVNENSIINTIPFKIKGHKIKDIVNYNKLSITEILQKSSNVGISKLALSIPTTALVDTYLRFGIGKSTNLGLVGEQYGLCPQKQNWTKIEKTAFSFGYGLMVTPLQLARVYATIGSYGIYRPLSIIKVNKPVLGKRIFSESIVRTVIKMMESASLPGGSGVKAAIKGYRIAIKTGTVKKVGSDGRYIKKYVAYAAGIAPASNPRFALIVVINDPKTGNYYGGTVSAPVFSTIMRGVLRTMNIKPDALKNNI